jgi:hypothetical protein
MSGDDYLTILADEEAATEILAMLAGPVVEPENPWDPSRTGL